MDFHYPSNNIFSFICWRVRFRINNIINKTDVFVEVYYSAFYKMELVCRDYHHVVLSLWGKHLFDFSTFLTDSLLMLALINICRFSFKFQFGLLHPEFWTILYRTRFIFSRYLTLNPVNAMDVVWTYSWIRWILLCLQISFYLKMCKIDSFHRFPLHIQFIYTSIS